MFEIPISARPLAPFVELVGAARVEAVTQHAAATRSMIGRHTVWNINSTAAGGGVAEILRSLLRYTRGLGIDTRWLVLEGPPEFFAVTKRLHNALHDTPGDDSALGAEQRAIYERVMAENLAQIEGIVRPGDVVVCHDPQTAGLTSTLAKLGLRVAWRCHIGHDGPGRYVDEGWAFLRPYLEDVPLAIFSREAYAPRWMPHSRTVTIPPNIDPFSTKNQAMSGAAVRGILGVIGLVDVDVEPEAAVFTVDGGEPRLVTRRVEVIDDGARPSWDAPLIVQVSRWDRMKDHLGVLEAFARLLARPVDDGAELVLAGPSVGGVADDPEGPEVLREVERAWRGLPERVRRRAHLVELPMDDTDENAAMVNALQRHAAIIVQKSLREGFGLTVTEAMWKRRPIVASAVGGIEDQIRDGIEGLLVRDPTDADETARALERVLESPDLAQRIRDAAYARVCERYLSVSALEGWARLLQILYA